MKKVIIMSMLLFFSMIAFNCDLNHEEKYFDTLKVGDTVDLNKFKYVYLYKEYDNILEVKVHFSFHKNYILVMDRDSYELKKILQYRNAN